MFNFLQEKYKSNCKILYISPDIDSGGAENILYNVLQKRRRKEVFIISLTDIGYYGKKLIRDGYKVYALNMKKNIFDFKSNFKSFKPLICFSVKANSNLNLYQFYIQNI